MSSISKTIVITGGTKGIGAAIAEECRMGGMSVLVGSRKSHGPVKNLDGQVRFKKMDVRRESDHIRLAQSALKWTGRLDVYINCAGYSEWRSVARVDQRFWETMIDTNLKGTFWGCKTAARFLSPGGVIINVSSLAGKRGSANNSVYCASKFGVTGLTQALAKELGPVGIRVNALCPVYVPTESLWDALKDKESPTKGKNINAYLKKFAREQAALGKLPTAREVAKACLFLASDKASAITGQSINIDCGVLPQ